VKQAKCVRYAFCADLIFDGCRDFQHQAHTILDRATEYIIMLVCAIFQELFQQITIRAMVTCPQD
jgi:hypothetical protein